MPPKAKPKARASAKPRCRGDPWNLAWFENVFGFPESTYLETRSRFAFADGALSVPSTGASFHVGLFEVISVTGLRARLAALPAAPEGDGLKFANIVGNAGDLHRDPDNAGAVFQAASQFNCLEMVTPGTRPQDGITGYAKDLTQGPACALACPAATAYRNYMVHDGEGQGAGHQIDCLSEIGELVQNDTRHYWNMTNGYAMSSTKDSIVELGNLIRADPGLAEAIRSRFQVGIHWDTEVVGGGHRVCQAFASACPISYSKPPKGPNASGWRPFAECVLDAIYDATLAAATCLALERRTRVKVYLTAVGAGAFGNATLWIVNAVRKALVNYVTAPLDVMLVHFKAIHPNFTALEHGRPRLVASAAGKPFEEEPPSGQAPELARSESEMAGVVSIFAALDLNGDGVIDHGELSSVLRKVDPDLFSDEMLNNILLAADANEDGLIHYVEFVAWVFGEDAVVASRLLEAVGAGGATS